MSQPEPDLTAITPNPTGATVTRIRREVQREGGRAHDIAHSDREVTMELPSRFNGKMKPTTVPLCTCGRNALVTAVDRPQVSRGIALKDNIRLCVVCDALPQWPRYEA